MSATSLAQRRRDPRYSVGRGFGTIEFTDTCGADKPLLGCVTQISTAGIAFELDDAVVPLEIGTLFGSVAIRVGQCALHGDIVVRTCRETSPPTITVGALFYPGTTECEDRLLGLIAGLAAGE